MNKLPQILHVDKLKIINSIRHLSTSAINNFHMERLRSYHDPEIPEGMIDMPTEEFNRQVVACMDRIYPEFKGMNHSYNKFYHKPEKLTLDYKEYLARVCPTCKTAVTSA